MLSDQKRTLIHNEPLIPLPALLAMNNIVRIVEVRMFSLRSLSAVAHLVNLTCLHILGCLVI